MKNIKTFESFLSRLKDDISYLTTRKINRTIQKRKYNKIKSANTKRVLEPTQTNKSKKATLDSYHWNTKYPNETNSKLVFYNSIPIKISKFKNSWYATTEQKYTETTKLFGTYDEAYNNIKQKVSKY